MAQYGWTQAVGPDYLPTGAIRSQDYHEGIDGMRTGWHWQPEGPGADMPCLGPAVIRQRFGYYPGCSLGDQSGRWAYRPGNAFNPYLANEQTHPFDVAINEWQMDNNRQAVQNAGCYDWHYWL